MHITVLPDADITLQTNVPAINRDLILEGQLDANHATPVLRGDGVNDRRALHAIDPNGTYSINNMTFRDFLTQSSGMDGAGGAVMLTDGGAVGSPVLDLTVTGMSNVHFISNKASAWGGGLYVRGTFAGDLVDSTFIDNQSGAGANGGAFDMGGDFTGNILRTTFANNTATDGKGGGLYVNRTFSGNIVDSVFIGNAALGESVINLGRGGAIRFRDMTGSIENTRFISNRTTLGGGAIVARTTGDFNATLFVNNSALGNATIAFSAGVGGALSLDNDVMLIDSVFLNNSASSLNPNGLDSGWGGALFHHDATNNVGATINVTASAGSQTLFYGNTQQPANGAQASSAIHFANGNETNADLKNTLNVQADGRVLMLDALSSQADGLTRTEDGTLYGNLETEVNKTGAGDWFLGGDSQMRGASTWNVNAGSLTLTTVDYGGSIGVQDAKVNLSHTGTSVFNLNAGGTLAGSGEVSAQTITLDGTVSPETWVNIGVKAPDIVAAVDAITHSVTAAVMADTSIAANDKLKTINQRILAQSQALVDVAKASDAGTLNLTGTVNLGATSVAVLDAHSSAALSDRINVTGTLDIAAGAAVAIRNTAAAWTLNTPVTLIDATNLTGGPFNEAFTGFDAFVFADPTLTYTGTQVQFSMQRNGTAFASFCQTHNQCAVAGAADTLPNTHPVAAALGGLELDTARRAYDNLSGEIYASTRAAMLANRRLRDTVATRARRPGDDEKLWVTTWGFDARMQGKRGIAGTDHRGIGLALGADVQLTASTSMGAVFAYEDDQVKHAASRNARAGVDAYSTGAYLVTSLGGIKFHAGALYSYLDVDTRRNLWVANLQGRAKSSASSHKVQVFGEMATDLTLGAVTLTPYAGVAQTWLTGRGTRESADGQAAAARLSIPGGTDRVTQTTVGLRAAYRLATAWPVGVYGDLAWSHALGDTNNKTRNRFVGTDNRFAVRGTGVAQNTALIGAGVQARLGVNATWTLGYQGEFGQKQKNHAASLQVKARF